MSDITIKCGTLEMLNSGGDYHCAYGSVRLVGILGRNPLWRFETARALGKMEFTTPQAAADDLHKFLVEMLANRADVVAEPAPPDTVEGELAGGGKWLGAARRWAQWNVPSGDTLQWDSRNIVSIPFAELWELARVTAVAAVREERQKRNAIVERRIDRWRVEAERDELLRILEKLESVNVLCQVCGAPRGDGHGLACNVGRALKRAEVPE